MKVLNIDAIVSTTERTIKFRGVVHPVVEMSVENFVVTTTDAERLEKEGVGIRSQVIGTADAILRSVPSLDKETLYGMSLNQLTVIYRFISGEDEFEDYENVVSDEEGGEKK
ncbi:hypothetical protein [Castellaniella sp.]|uniref:hypothetical protein n=1 Tax=Castellaniella sp. TaxID=1955812 RepID=UPI002AFFAF5F|nr:hypothetical protein [Castellaniella sp.]